MKNTGDEYYSNSGKHTQNYLGKSLDLLPFLETRCNPFLQSETIRNVDPLRLVNLLICRLVESAQKATMEDRYRGL